MSVIIPWLEVDSPFPDVVQALTTADGAPGLLAAGADLSVTRLLKAYRQGIFPWFMPGEPVLWWSTDPRLVLFVDRFKISRSLHKTLKKIQTSMDSGGAWQVRFDTAFLETIKACALPRYSAAGATGTWISADIIQVYYELYKLGHAHSAELWRNDQLVAGAYGVSIGRMFYGESMFAHVTDGSKIALAYLVHFLKIQQVEMIDCQQETAHLASLGAVPVSRTVFMDKLQKAIQQPNILEWIPVNFR